MGTALTKRDWILLALSKAALDRLRLMKALFLIWLESGRNIHDYFEFVPYLYGPCSFEVYSVLAELQRENLVVQAPQFPLAWASYYLTHRGRQEAARAEEIAHPDELAMIQEWAQFTKGQDFHSLLKHVYHRAPEFAVNSLVLSTVASQR